MKIGKLKIKVEDIKIKRSKIIKEKQAVKPSPKHANCYFTSLYFKRRNKKLRGNTE
jgi:hypothetical protein